MIEVYHGGVERIEKPLAKVGRKNLDFGQGFYLTRRLQQAEEWAIRIARQRMESPVVNVYELDIDTLRQNFRYHKFDCYDSDWLHFIVSCRGGYNPSDDYDCIEGGVANDRVIDTVEGYINGTIDEDHAISELSKHSPNNQLCILNQSVIDNCLTFKDIK